MSNNKTYLSILENEREFQRLQSIMNKLESIYWDCFYNDDTFTNCQDKENPVDHKIHKVVTDMIESLYSDMTKLSKTNQELIKSGLNIASDKDHNSYHNK